MIQIDRYKILSGSVLKLFACLLMLLDHLAVFYFADMPWAHQSLFHIGEKAISSGFIFHSAGRLAFPIFAFLIVEGFFHTHDRRRYALNLLILALVSEIPWNLVHTGTIFCPKQNVIFTLLFGYLGLCAIERFKEKPSELAASLLGLLLLSIVARADYGCFGYGFILLLYLLRDNELLRAVIGCCVLPSRWVAGLSFIPITMYDGNRGFAKSKFAKYCFYAFYPLHLLIIALL